MTSFICNGCHDDPCLLVVDDAYWIPKNCPFDASVKNVEWSEQGAKNTEQANQPDSGK